MVYFQQRGDQMVNSISTSFTGSNPSITNPGPIIRISEAAPYSLLEKVLLYSSATEMNTLNRVSKVWLQVANVVKVKHLCSAITAKEIEKVWDDLGYVNIDHFLNFVNKYGLHNKVTRLNYTVSVKSLTILSQLSRLQILEINAKGFESIDPLGNLKQLQSLTISKCKALRPFSAFGELTSLNRLVLLYFKQPNPLEGIEKLRSITHLALYSVNITSLLPISSLTGLTELALHGCISLTSLDGIRSLDANLKEMAFTTHARKLLNKREDKDAILQGKKFHELV